VAKNVLGWLKRRKAVASTAAIALVAGVPVALAATHHGYPVADVSLNAQDVWVTDGSSGGRVNHQIGQLDAKVDGPANDVDILQNGGGYFLVSSAQHSVARIDPANVATTDQLATPAGAQVLYGGDTLAILGSDGKLWTLDASRPLQFSTKDKPAAELGRGAAAVVSTGGEVFAVSPAKHELVTVAKAGGRASSIDFAVKGAPLISAVGGTAVVLDSDGTRLRTPSRTLAALPSDGSAALSLQQPSAESGYVLASSASALYRFPLDGGDPAELRSGAPAPASTGAEQVPAPVQAAGCDYAAWSANARYLYACGGAAPSTVAIPQQHSGAQLRFRVNHDVVVLNDLASGDYWIASSSLKFKDDWATLAPKPDTTKTSDKGAPKKIYQSFAEEALKRDPNKNNPPKAQDDEFGVRPGRATILPVLDNDTDQDGDVLTVAKTDPIPAATGVLDLIDGGRALQFTPAPDYTGGFVFGYTATDGRPQGEAHATVRVSVHESGVETPPRSVRGSGVQVEAGQSVAYNVLQDWVDDDGDDIYLVNATPDGGGTVSYTADGEITFTAPAGQVGTRTVTFTVSDGPQHRTGKLTVTVGKPGSLAPIAAPDFVTATLGEPVTVSPLANDTSRSGAQLQLVGADAAGTPLQVSQHLDEGTLTITGTQTGPYYVTYQVAAGSGAPAKGIIRVDVVDAPKGEQSPLAVSDVAYVHPGQTTQVAPLDNDISPSGRVLAVQSVTGGADAALLNIQLLDNTIVKITSPGMLTAPVQLTYQLTDGLKTSPGTITVVPVASPVTFQPPVAEDDQVTVRAGDYATVDVLANDYSPDDTPIGLDPTLVSAKSAGGTVFVAGSSVRYLAPRTAGSYSATYQITDDNGQHDQAQVTFTVLAASKLNEAPEPKTLTARAFAGSSIPIQVPLDGLDPNGDSVYFDSIDDEPQLGTITSQNASGFVYAAGADQAGTDEFGYTVEDSLGKTAEGTVRIAVIPRPESLQPPVPVNDHVQVKPGATASIPVLANDSDPNGFPLTLDGVDQVDKHLSGVDLDGSSVLVTAPQQLGTYQLHYTVSNGHGGKQGAYVQVTVNPNAPPRYPSASDHFVDPKQLSGRAGVAVDALQGAVNPSGPVDDLGVALPGVAAKIATVAGGTVTVFPQATRTVVPYEVTDPATKLTAKAFLVVPPANIAASGAQASANPGGASSRPQQPQADDPSRQPAAAHSSAPSSTPSSSAGRRTGDDTGPTKAPTAKTSAPAKDSSPKGGSSSKPGTSSEPSSPSKPGTGSKPSAKPSSKPGSPSSPSAGGSTPKSTPKSTPSSTPKPSSTPDASKQTTFTPPTVTVYPGQTSPTVVDLRSATSNPDKKALAAVTYTKLQQSSIAGVDAALDGSKMTITPTNAARPSPASQQFRFTMTSGSLTRTEWVNVIVVQDPAGPAQQLNPPQKRDLARGETVTIADAVGTADWSNPHPDAPLTISGLQKVSGTDGVTTTLSGSSITITAASGAGIGVSNYTYTVTTSTGVTSTGRLTVTVHWHPATPVAPSGVSANAGTASFTINAPNDNGLAIGSYQVRDNHGDSWTYNGVGAKTVGGLSNGTSYTFQVKAHNADGWSDWSAPSAAVTPYGTPGEPTHVKISANSSYAPSKFTQQWQAPGNTGGGAVKYEWKFDGNSGTISGTSRTTGSKDAGTYSFQVRAVSVATGRASSWVTSNSVKISDPPKDVTLAKGKKAPKGHYYQISVSGFGANKTYDVLYYCDGSRLRSYVDHLTTGPKGNGSLDSSTTSNYPYCGFPNAWVTVGGTKSNTKNMK